MLIFVEFTRIKILIRVDFILIKIAICVIIKKTAQE